MPRGDLVRRHENANNARQVATRDNKRPVREFRERFKLDFWPGYNRRAGISLRQPMELHYSFAKVQLCR